jgi:hypothetical protein
MSSITEAEAEAKMLVEIYRSVVEEIIDALRETLLSEPTESLLREIQPKLTCMVQARSAEKLPAFS